MTGSVPASASFAGVGYDEAMRRRLRHQLLVALDGEFSSPTM